jgi:hypothetical protein
MYQKKMNIQMKLIKTGRRSLINPNYLASAYFHTKAKKKFMTLGTIVLRAIKFNGEYTAVRQELRKRTANIVSDIQCKGSVAEMNVSGNLSPVTFFVAKAKPILKSLALVFQKAPIRS